MAEFDPEPSVAEFLRESAFRNCPRHPGKSSNRYWILQPRLPHLGVFIAVGIAITIVFEWHATEIAQRWTYADHMPVLPVLGTGMLPLLQWTLLPPLIAWLVSRQIGR